MAGRPRLSSSAVEQRRRALIEAAVQLIADKGFDATQVADVASAAGTGHGTVYRYFRDKAELLDGVMAYAVERVMAALSDVPPTANTLEEYRRQSDRIGERLFELAYREPAVARLLFFWAPAAP